MRRARALVTQLVVLLLLASAGAANGAIVRVEPTTRAPIDQRPGPDLLYDALPGERNDMLIRLAGQIGDPKNPSRVFYSVADHGAPLVPGPGCYPNLEGGGLICETFGVAQRVHAELGDGDDIAALTVPHASLSGGDGADTLTTGHHPHATVDPGRGDDAVTALGVNAGVYYTRRSEPVFVDLAAGTGGASGENDTLAGFVNLFGGSGGDVLLGDDDKNHIGGGPGDDWIDGRGDSDRIECGAGFDTYVPDPSDTLVRGCEAWP